MMHWEEFKHKISVRFRNTATTWLQLPALVNAVWVYEAKITVRAEAKQNTSDAGANVITGTFIAHFRDSFIHLLFTARVAMVTRPPKFYGGQKLGAVCACVCGIYRWSVGPLAHVVQKHSTRIYSITTIYSTGLHAQDTLLIPKCTSLCVWP